MTSSSRHNDIQRGKIRRNLQGQTIKLPGFYFIVILQVSPDMFYSNLAGSSGGSYLTYRTIQLYQTSCFQAQSNVPRDKLG